MTPPINRRHFIYGLCACAMLESTGDRSHPGDVRSLRPKLSPALIQYRIGLALDLQALFSVAIDQVDIDALTTDRVLFATPGYGEGKNRFRDAALAAVHRHGPGFKTAAGSLLLLGVRSRALRLSELAAARQAVRSKGGVSHQSIYAIYPDRNLGPGQVEATLIAAWG
jgi:hypothetical protein